MQINDSIDIPSLISLSLYFRNKGLKLISSVFLLLTVYRRIVFEYA